MIAKLGIIADTHNRVPHKLAEVLAGVELILHAGDVMNRATLKRLAAIAPLRVVRGNNDSELPSEIPDSDLVEFHGLRIGLTHGHLFSFGTPGKREMVEHFRVEQPDLIVCGHSHCFADELIDGMRLVNPGTASMHWFGGHPSAILLSKNSHAYHIERMEL